MTSAEIKRIIKEEFEDKVSFDEPLAPHTTFEIGGPADIYIRASNVNDITRIFELARQHSIQVFVLGSGSNILVSDKGFRGIVVKNELGNLTRRNNSLYVESGVELGKLLGFCAREGLTGLEFMSGIYGTLGGAVFGNAGAYGHAIGEFVRSLRVIDRESKIRDYDATTLKFSYRRLKIDGLEDGFFFVASCLVNLEKSQPNDITATMESISKARAEKMYNPLPSAGCFFKNVENPQTCFTKNGRAKLGAGELLEGIGAKTMGSAKVGVHPLHANIIMNRGRASALEVLEFAESLRKKVLEKFGITLEFEVKLVGEF